MNIIYQWLEYVVSFAEAALVFLTVTAICESKWTNKRKYLIIFVGLCLVEVVFVSILNAISPFSFITLFIFAVYFTLASAALSKGKIKDRCMAVILAFFVLHTIDYVTGFSFALIMEQTSDIYSGFSAAMAPGKTRAFYLIADKVIQGVVLLAFRSWYQRIREFDEENKNKLMIVLFISYVISAVLLSMIISTSPVVMQSAIILSWIFILLANLVMIGFIYQTSCNKEKEYENRFMKYQRDILSSSYEQLSETYKQQRKMIHDFKNHLKTIEELSKGNESVDAYLQDSKAMVASLPVLCHSGNDYIDAIVNYKETEAKNKDIRFIYSIELADDIQLTPMDICTILANQIDNAIEAAEKIENPALRYVQVNIAQKQRYTFFRVENSIKEGSVSEQEIFNTTKENKRDHGIGISNIESVAERYSGSLQMEINPSKVISIVMVQTKK